MGRRRVFQTVLLLCVAPVLLTPKLVLAQTATDFVDGSIQITPIGPGSSIQLPPSVVYGATSAGPSTGAVIQQSLPVLGGVLNGGGLTNAIPGAVNVLGPYLPAGTGTTIQQALPILQGVLSGNLNTGAILNTAAPYLTQLLGAGTAGTVTSALPILNQILSGNFNVSSLLSSAGGLIGNLFGGGGGGSIFSTTTGILGSILGGGGGGSTFALSPSLAGIFPDATTGALSDQVFGIDSSGGSSATNTNTVLAQTGTVLCLYNSSCLQSNPSAYKSLYSSAAGAMGFSDPTQVRGQIAQLSQSGVMPDAFASRFNTEQNNYYVGNYSDREIARANSVPVLSKAGQAAQKQAIQAAQQTSQKLTQLSDQCAQTSKSSQELIRCDMQVNTAVPSFQAAQISLETHAQIDRNLQSTMLNNISSAIDGLNRQQDVDRGATSARLFREATMSFPVTGKQ